jgi:hypothetical protein
MTSASGPHSGGMRAQPPGKPIEPSVMQAIPFW